MIALAQGTAGTAQTTGQGGQTASGTVQPPKKVPEFGMNKFDPYLDNHLRAPALSDKTGLFGMPIRDVENLLREYGAKNYSYAFGKYSRMSISAYVITMYFDRERKLGGVSIEPMAPYKIIGPDARKFFLDLFLKSGDMSKFKSIISASKLELRYSP
ncbi:MAG: hypothetical protein PWR01_3109 [Clostridiales bacterium]|nr:hypothetical protein [Clostridiales bacterium]MDN5282036.1 hypothetical protein [Candidatus Ozemobacter sp.]